MAASEIRGVDVVAVRWTRIVAVAVLCGVTLEILAQLYFLVWAGRPFDSTALYVWSPYGLVRNNPAATSPGYAINGNGFRDLRDYTRRAPERTVRVLLLGGSVLYAGLAEVSLTEEGRVDSGSTIAQFLQAQLAADPELAGVNVEVLNAAVNFNRLPEITAAYAGEYAWWDPHVVVVFGSANNFFYTPAESQFRDGAFGLRLPHPWAAEFQRLNNETSPASASERLWRVAGDGLASVAILQKAVSKVIDASQGLAGRSSLSRPAAGRVDPPVNADGRDAGRDARYFADYAALADGLTAMVRGGGGDIVYFWEYFLQDVASRKPLSERERWLAGATEGNLAWAPFHWRMRERWLTYMQRRGVAVIDPLERLQRDAGTIFIDYLHYTRYGNRVMADETYRVIRPMVVRKAATIR